MGPTDASDRGFTGMGLAHQSLDPLFARHQEALREKKLGEALERFEEYASAVLDHLEAEEGRLLPFYKKDMERFRSGGFEDLLSEHRKISEGLVLIRVILQKLIGGTEVDMTYRLLLKEEFYFLKLLHAHERNEERIYSPKLEKILGRTN